MPTTATAAPVRKLCCAPDMCPICVDEGGHLTCCEDGSEGFACEHPEAG